MSLLKLFGVWERPGMFSLWVQAIGPGEGAHAFELGPLVVRTSPVEHGSMPNFAVRADAGARGVVYSSDTEPCDAVVALARGADTLIHEATFPDRDRGRFGVHSTAGEDRKSTRLNSSHLVISYAVFCLKKKKSSTI